MKTAAKIPLVFAEALLIMALQFLDSYSIKLHVHVLCSCVDVLSIGVPFRGIAQLFYDVWGLFYFLGADYTILAGCGPIQADSRYCVGEIPVCLRKDFLKFVRVLYPHL